MPPGPHMGRHTVGVAAPDGAGMTGPGADFRATTCGYGQRRSWLFSAWRYPSALACSGAVHAGLSVVFEQSTETGLVMAILGAVFAALGWIATPVPRFGRRSRRRTYCGSNKVFGSRPG